MSEMLRVKAYIYTLAYFRDQQRYVILFTLYTRVDSLTAI